MTLSSTALRLIVDGPLDGAVNMARDEALLTRVGRHVSPPTLRLYRWSNPTISLGYFQHAADRDALGGPEGELPTVRRLTGGGAILHDLELTYSITLPVGHPLVAGRPNRLYELAHDAVIDVLGGLGIETARCGTSDDSGAARGPFFCFARRHCYDVVLQGDKLAGSAQRRTREAMLQHGSIILGNRFAQQPTADAGGHFETLVTSVERGFPDALGRVAGIRLEVGQWEPDELDEASGLASKYAGEDWTRRT